MRVAAKIVLEPAERQRLKRLSRLRSTSVRLAERAKIVLLAAEGKENGEIAEILGISRQKVGRWRNRYYELGLTGIEKDAPRPGRKKKISKRTVNRVVKLRTQEKPANATHWSRRLMAGRVNISESAVGRIWRAHGLKLHRVDTFKLSNDKHFQEKLEKLKSWLKYHKRFHVHFTPTSASWLNMVERFFRDLSEQQLRRGVFRSVSELEEAVMGYIEKYNDAPAPFIWTRSAQDILEKVKRGRQTLNKLQSV